ncbi:Invasion protein IalB, involved in pathogenesis [Poseidonocella pacifica]|uniref:Invasion protein IalB, involved in pathogenesis n=1 Tax=Poseidonocella pacifica TaxID=871651 RepID=A0A1I0X7V8_9RHOB|nr:invasion associated locus B family protein [Poseidonocella pacifica]SFA97085.1 Invasion protein IalB, involved in pathogenesis [Poseidonocella pacifica]
MSTSIRLLASLAFLAASGTAFAQDAEEAPAGDAPATELSMGEQAEAASNEPYVKEEFGDWDLRCVRAEAGGEDPCQLYQLLRDEQGNSVAEISLFRLEGNNRAVAGATVVVPLETLLTANARIAVDGNQTKTYPFSFCNQIGCYARIGLTPEDIAIYKAGNKATLTIVPFSAPDQQVALDISLSGFTAGYDKVSRARID